MVLKEKTCAHTSLKVEWVDLKQTRSWKLDWIVTKSPHCDTLLDHSQNSESQQFHMSLQKHLSNMVNTFVQRLQSGGETQYLNILYLCCSESFHLFATFHMFSNCKHDKYPRGGKRRR